MYLFKQSSNFFSRKTVPFDQSDCSDIYCIIGDCLNVTFGTEVKVLNIKFAFIQVISKQHVSLMSLYII